MNNNLKSFIFLLLFCLVFTGFDTVQAKTDNVKTDEIITFKDKKLENALCSVYHVNGKPCVLINENNAAISGGIL